MSEVISSFKSLRAGSQVFVIFMLLACSSYALPFGMFCFVCHQYDVCTNYVGSVYVGGYGGLSESGLCVFRVLCPVIFLVVGESPSVLL